MGLIFSVFAFCCWTQAEIIFPDKDPYSQEKQIAIEEILAIFPKNSSLQTVLHSDKVILWANSVLMKNAFTGEVTPVTEPNFSAMTTNNEVFLRTQMEEICQCSLMGKQIGGIIVADPYHAAEMYYREGWLGHLPNEVEGYAPPITIIYHEFSHAGDYLKDQNYFFDLASMSSKQWKNGAEQSAVVQQNDFTRAMNLQKGTNFKTRLSYGKHQLYKTTGLFAIDRLNENSM
jgi:hypothetical protein